jgi:hypothetical protein
MATLEKRIETLEQQCNSHDTSSVLLLHLGVLDGPMPSAMQGDEIKPPPLDDRLIASLIAGAESAMFGGAKGLP